MLRWRPESPPASNTNTSNTTQPADPVASLCAPHKARHEPDPDKAPQPLMTTSTTTASNDGGVLDNYRAQIRGFDEMIGPDGNVRPHYLPVLRAITQQGVERSSALSERIQRRIVENGLTLDSFSDLNNLEQPWKLNLIPVVLPAADWQVIEQGLTQRMRLLEALLNDLYGEQKSLASGLLPPSLIFNDPSYLRPVHGIPAPFPRLMFMAADIARDLNGQWRIIDIHAETIAGHGYALANRVVLADVSARMFRDCNARRISQFYNDVTGELARRTSNAEPTIAILGPNPDQETYLSNAYMARYLGYLQLEGADLRVVDNRLYHKTLAGLQPIDLLIRAVEAAKADPLELDPNGFEGPPALVQAVRTNPALVANALGTAIIENRGLAPYLPGLSRTLIGEEPIFPDSQRLWLGDPAIRDTILANLDAYLIRTAYEGTARPGHARKAQRISDLDEQARAKLIADIRTNGARYVAEQPDTVATAPSWTEKGMVPKPYAVRVFLAATEHGYQVMPGGVALTIDAGTAVGLTSDIAESRDIWIADDEPQGPHYSRWRISEEESQVQRLGSQLPSRVSDNLYWLGRYVERADWTMRVMRNALNRGDEDLRPIRRTNAAESAIGILINKGRPESETTAQSANGHSLEDRVEELFAAAGRPYGIRTTFQNIRSVARQSRDRLSLDSWRILSALTATPSRKKTPTNDPSTELVERLDQQIAQLAAFNGLMHENMTRNFGWRFLDLGRRIERALQISEFLRNQLTTAAGEADETERLAFLLETADSFMTYRARYRFAPAFPLVLDLLMVDETNPRSLAFQLVELSDQIAGLPKASLDAVRTPEQRLALELLTHVRLTDLDKLREADEAGHRTALVAFLDHIIERLPQLSDTLSRRYFSLTEEQPRRVHTRLAH